MSLWIRLERPVAFDAEGQAVQFAVRGDDHIAVIVKTEADQPDPRDDDLGFRVGRDADDAAMPAPARGDVEVAGAIKSHALRAAQAGKEPHHLAIRRNADDA